jgi:hypothetical protein
MDSYQLLICTKPYFGRPPAAELLSKLLSTPAECRIGLEARAASEFGLCYLEQDLSSEWRNAWKRRGC